MARSTARNGSSVRGKGTWVDREGHRAIVRKAHRDERREALAEARREVAEAAAAEAAIVADAAAVFGAIVDAIAPRPLDHFLVTDAWAMAQPTCDTMHATWERVRAGRTGGPIVSVGRFVETRLAVLNPFWD